MQKSQQKRLSYAFMAYMPMMNQVIKFQKTVTITHLITEKMLRKYVLIRI